MGAFFIYAAALAFSYYLAKVILLLLAIVAVFCTVVVCIIFNDVRKMLRLRKARREQRQ